MLEVRRKDGESFESMIRRFTKKTIQSGRILQAKKIRFHNKEKSERELKDSALRRIEVGSKIEYMKKIGKYDEAMQKRKKRR